MKHRFDWCDAKCKRMFADSPYGYMVFHCANTSTDYSMLWCPTFCPICGGKLTDTAHQRYTDVQKGTI